MPWAGLAMSIVLAGIASIALRQDSNWDLQNYHYYNAWAFVHGRFGIDWAPAQLQSFYSPFLDLPFYALVAADVPPRMIAFALAIPTGIAWYCFARIVATLFASLPATTRRPAIVAAIAIGVTAPMSVSLIGLTMNDWYVGGLRDGRRSGWSCAARPPSHATLLAAGALVGAGAGLKLTGCGVRPRVARRGGSPSTARGAARARRVWSRAGAMAAAFALTAGPWMWLMYERYGNPLFPYFNDIFRSPWADPSSFSATRFGPTSLREWLVFPFVLLWKLQDYVSEAEFRDARPALLYALALLAFDLALLRRALRPPDIRERHAAASWRFLGVFFLVSFVAWAVLYRIFRYLVPLEIAGRRRYRVLHRSPRRRAGACTLALAAAFAAGDRHRQVSDVVAAEIRGSLSRRSRCRRSRPNALVLLVSTEPMSYVLPSFPADARFAGLVSNFNDPDRTNLLQQTIAAAIRDHRGPLYALAVPPDRDDGGAAPWPRWDWRGNRARQIRTNLRVSPLELCELRRIVNGIRYHGSATPVQPNW